MEQTEAMEQLTRIRQMEKAFDDSREALEALIAALDRFETVMPALQGLITYYQGDVWMRDYVDDSFGKLPSDLKRGVLSQDGVYDLLADYSQVLDRMQEIVEALPEDECDQ